MLGWSISVFRLADGGSKPAAETSPEGELLAAWSTGLGGLDWLDALVKEGRAVFLGGDGYPYRYVVKAGFLLPPILSGPPLARDPAAQARTGWVIDTYRGVPVFNELSPDEVDFFRNRKPSNDSMVDESVAAACDRDEWLLVVAFDRS